MLGKIEMKVLFVVVLVASLGATGCAYWGERLGLVTLAQLAPLTASGEVFAGAYGFYAKHRRWPHDLAEIKEGLAVANRAPKHIHSITNLVIKEDGKDLTIYYDSPGIWKRGKLRLGHPQKKKPNKSVHPTAGTVTPRAEQNDKSFADFKLEGTRRASTRRG